MLGSSTASEIGDTLAVEYCRSDTPYLKSSLVVGRSLSGTECLTYRLRRGWQGGQQAWTLSQSDLSKRPVYRLNQTYHVWLGSSDRRL